MSEEDEEGDTSLLAAFALPDNGCMPAPPPPLKRKCSGPTDDQRPAKAARVSNQDSKTPQTLPEAVEAELSLHFMPLLTEEQASSKISFLCMSDYWSMRMTELREIDVETLERQLVALHSTVYVTLALIVPKERLLCLHFTLRQSSGGSTREPLVTVLRTPLADFTTRALARVDSKAIQLTLQATTKGQTSPRDIDMIAALAAQVSAFDETTAQPPEIKMEWVQPMQLRALVPAPGYYKITLALRSESSISLEQLRYLFDMFPCHVESVRVMCHASTPSLQVHLRAYSSPLLSSRWVYPLWTSTVVT